MRAARSIIFVTLCGLAVEPVVGQQVTGEQVRDAIESARRFLLANQEADGSWDDFRSYPGGVSCLATLALLNSGVAADTIEMRRALDVVQRTPLQRTYVVSLKSQALAASGSKAMLPQIQQCADWLIRAQQKNGMWGYDEQPGARTDFSNSQFALLGLHEARRAGAKVPDAIWIKARASWVNSQQGDGGWAYMPGGGNSTGSMTSAGVASLYICGNELLERRNVTRDSQGRVVCCQPPMEFRPMARGLNWLANNFSSATNPGMQYWYYYYMYAVERAGIISGLRYYGKHDWYRAGAAALVRRQNAGSWREVNETVDTSFALLFLAKGHRPILVHKLRFNEQSWNLTRNDLAHLVAFLGDSLGEPVSWESLEADADAAAWQTAPLLYINSQDLPRFKEVHVARLEEYIRQGGTVLITSACYIDKARTFFDEFVLRAFPDFAARDLDADHPVYKSLHQVSAADAPLLGLDMGCRTSVFFCPWDIGCLWELGDVPAESERAFKMGANIAAYATGLEPLPDKLDVVRKTQAQQARQERSTPQRGAVQIAQLMHNGDWRPNPKAVPNLAEHLLNTAGLDMVAEYEPLAADDPKLAQYPIVYMTGHYGFELKPAEVEGLRKHLQRGGFLLATACCGRQPFDESFRKLATTLFPDHPLEPLPGQHPILLGQPGVPIQKVRYRQSTLAENPLLNAPVLVGISI